MRCFGRPLSFLRRLGDSIRRRLRSAVQQEESGQEMVYSRRASSFWETFIPGGGSSATQGDSSPLSGSHALHWHPARLPRRTSTGSGSAGRPSFLSTRPSFSRFGGHPAPPPLHPYHIFATTFDMNNRFLPLHDDRRDCGEEGGRAACELPPASPSGDMDPVLRRGLEAWIPARTSLGAQYHLYVVAVQRCRALSRLKQIVLTHLGGSGRYVLAGSAEIGDALSGRTAILLFARTVDVESRAFRLLASSQRPVVLRGGVRGGVKGVLGMVRGDCFCLSFCIRVIWKQIDCAPRLVLGLTDLRRHL